ncbi:MAG: B12-binding domain-containing radical SAM protein [Alphaproteobacteria bacterium]
MKILFINLPDFQTNYQFHKEMGGGMGYKNLRSERTKRKIYPIVDLINAATIVKKKHESILLDSQFFDFENTHNLVRHIINKLGKKIDFFFVRTSLPTIKSDNKITQELQKNFPRSKFFAFGPVFASQDIIKYFKKKQIFDGIISSEIEAVIEKLLNSNSFKNFPSGVFYKQGEIYKVNNEKRLFADINLIPFPDYSLVDYSQIDKFIIQTQRGCPMACNYCPYYISQGLKFRSHDPKKMIEQFKYLNNRFGANKIIIHDPIFTLDVQRVSDFCDLLIKEKLDVEWECETHMKQIDKNLLIKMKRAGNIKMSFGVESANNDVLKRANRRFDDWNKIKDNIDYCKSIGIHTRAYFVLALEGDDVKGIYSTIDLMKFLGPDSANFGLPNLYPGTGAYQNAIENGMIEVDKNYDEFLESLGNHSDKNQRSLTKKLNTKQIILLKMIANHTVIILNSGFFRRIISSLKVIIYKTVVKYYSLQAKILPIRN